MEELDPNRFIDIRLFDGEAIIIRFYRSTDESPDNARNIRFERVKSLILLLNDLMDAESREK